MKVCTRCHKQGIFKTSIDKRRHRSYTANICEACRGVCNKDRFLNDPRIQIWTNASWRAKRAAVPFSITREDIIIPRNCPILGVSSQTWKFTPKRQFPRLDRLWPELGYVPGNVFVISHRANRIKSNGTAIEHLKNI